MPDGPAAPTTAPAPAAPTTVPSPGAPPPGAAPTTATATAPVAQHQYAGEELRTFTCRGRTQESAALAQLPRSYEETVRAVHSRRGTPGGIPRGAGTASGDAALSAGGAVLDLRGLDRIHEIDVESGTVRADAGVTLGALARAALPHGWFPPLAPGAGAATVGGALATEAYGPDHPYNGSFSRHVARLELLLPDGEIRTVTPGSALFAATAGGLGLTGAVLGVTLRLAPVGSPFMVVSTRRAENLDAVLAGLAGARRRYVRAWLDLSARGSSLGRGMLEQADHVPADELPCPDRRSAADGSNSEASSRSRSPFRSVPLSGRLLCALDRARPGTPRGPGHGLPGRVGTAAERLWGAARFRTTPEGERLCSTASWFGTGTGSLLAQAAGEAALERLGEYGDRRPWTPRSLRWECQIPYGRRELLRRLVAGLAAAGAPSASLIRLGEGGPGLLGFAAPGWALAARVPLHRTGAFALLDRMDTLVAESGGRVRVAGDSRLRPELLDLMYPGAADFRTLRDTAGRGSPMVSDLSRRLGL